MKKTPIIVTSIVIAFLALGYLLYKVSPPPVSALELKYYDLSQAKKIDQPVEVSSDDHILGNPSAKNTIVAYEDIQCPACRSFKPILEQLPTALTDTKLVFRHFPLYPSPHPNSLAAAYASEAASAQGKFWEFTDLLYERQEDWADLANPLDKFVEIAQTAGVLDTAKFKADILASKYEPKIEKDNMEGAGLGVNATPTIFFNSHKLVLKQGTLDEIKSLVEPYYIK